MVPCTEDFGGAIRASGHTVVSGRTPDEVAAEGAKVESSGLTLALVRSLGPVIGQRRNVHTVELFIYSRTEADGAPPIGLEEDVLVARNGAETLTDPQRELMCIG
jgi:hypothetical protein